MDTARSSRMPPRGIRDERAPKPRIPLRSIRATRLPLAVWQNLPAYLDAATPYPDIDDQALVYGFDLPERTGKVIIRINYLAKLQDGGKRRKVLANFIRTGGLIEPENLGERRYVPLRNQP